MQMNPEVLLRLVHDQQARIMNLEGENFALRDTLKREIEKIQQSQQTMMTPSTQAELTTKPNGFDKLHERMKDMPISNG